MKTMKIDKLSEIKGYYKVNTMSPDDFIKLVQEWRSDEIENERNRIEEMYVSAIRKWKLETQNLKNKISEISDIIKAPYKK